MKSIVFGAGDAAIEDASGVTDHYCMECATECSVCLAGISDEDHVQTLPCGHGFHEHCIVRWAQTSNQCPMCRTVHPELESIKKTADMRAMVNTVARSLSHEVATPRASAPLMHRADSHATPLSQDLRRALAGGSAVR